MLKKVVVIVLVAFVPLGTANAVNYKALKTSPKTVTQDGFVCLTDENCSCRTIHDVVGEACRCLLGPGHLYEGRATPRSQIRMGVPTCQ